MFTKDILVSQPERSEPAEKKKEANACYACYARRRKSFCFKRKGFIVLLITIVFFFFFV